VPRLLAGLAGVVVAVVAVVLFLVVLSGRDAPGVPSRPGGPGRPAGASSSPPAAGPERAGRVTREGASLSRAQLVSELARGNVVVLYAGPRPPAALRRLVLDVSGERFSSRLAREGQAVILGRYPGVTQTTALAWGHVLRAASPADRRLVQFADYWLGAGAPG
jgi:Protein of unknown function (DUF3105)